MARLLACLCTYYAGLSVATITVEEDEVKLAIDSARLCTFFFFFFHFLWFTTVVFNIIMFVTLAILVVTFLSI